MIRVTNGITENKLQEIEQKHWQWFKDNKLKNLIIKMKSNESLVKVFFKDKNEFDNWMDKENGESYIKWFKRQDDKKFNIFKDFILGKREKLIELKDDIGEIYDINEEDSINKYFKNMYTEFRSANDGWCGSELINSLGVKVCPYCNRTYIDSYRINANGKIKSNAQIDHFYSKDKYPYLALSLYNLIPSCSSCNHSKGNNQNEVVYPYTEQFGNEGKFTTEFESDDEIYKYDLSYLYGKSDNFKILLNIKEESNIKNSIEASNKVFKLEEIYNCYKQQVKDLLLKNVIYDTTTINELYNNYSNLFESKEDLIRIIFATYVEQDDLGKVPLAKLYRDILEDCGFDFLEI